MSPSNRDDPLVLKVHRVASAAEAEQMERAGADLIGFHVDDDVVFQFDQSPRFTDDRYVLLESIPELLGGLDRARGVVEVPSAQWSPELPAMLRGEGASFVQVDVADLPDDELLERCTGVRLGVIYGGASIEPEDPPSRYGRVLSPDRPAVAFYDLHLFPSYPEGWKFLRDVAPAHGDEAVTLDDIAALASRLPLLVSLDLHPSARGEALAALRRAGVRGITFTLGATESSSYRTFDVDAVSEVVDAIRLAEAR